MSLREIAEVVTALQKREERQNKMMFAYIYQLGALVGCAVNNGKEYPKSVYDAFPEIFSEKPIPDWQRQKANMLAYAENHNKKIGGE